MPEQMFNLHISLNNDVINKCSLALKGVEMNWSHVTNILINLRINSIHTWLANGNRLTGMTIVLDIKNKGMII